MSSGLCRVRSITRLVWTLICIMTWLFASITRYLTRYLIVVGEWVGVTVCGIIIIEIIITQIIAILSGILLHDVLQVLMLHHCFADLFSPYLLLIHQLLINRYHKLQSIDSSTIMIDLSTCYSFHILFHHPSHIAFRYYHAKISVCNYYRST